MPERQEMPVRGRLVGLRGVLALLMPEVVARAQRNIVAVSQRDAEPMRRRRFRAIALLRP